MPTLYPLPEIIDPEDKICVTLKIPNEINHIGAFLGAIYNLTRWYSWERDEAKSGKNVALVWTEIYDELIGVIGTQSCGGGDFPMLRQNPDSPCQMQYQDNLGQWITFYDFSLCGLFGINLDLAGIINYTETNSAQTLVNNEIQIYNANPNDYPTEDTVNSAQVDDRNTLLCFALRVIISQTLETIARNKEEADRNAVTLSMIIGAGVALGFAPLSPIVIGSILFGFSAGWTGAMLSINQDQLRDQSAIDEVLCHLYFQLEGDNFTRANLQSSVSVNPFDSGSNAYKMIEVLRPMLNTLQMYLAIVNHMKENLPSVEALVNECLNCGDDTEWSHTFDFTISQFATQWTAQPFNVSQMSWLAGTGWRHGLNIPTSNLRFVVAYLRSFVFPQNAFIHGYDVYYSFVATTVGDNLETRIQYLTELDGVNSSITETDISASSHSDVVYKSVEKIVDRLKFQIVGGRRAGSNPNGSITITKIVVTGKGYNPFI